MKRFTCHDKILKFTYIKVTLLFLLIGALSSNGMSSTGKNGQNYFHVFLDGIKVGVVGSISNLDDLYLEARKSVAARSDDLLFLEPLSISFLGEELLYGDLDDEETILHNMEAIIAAKATTSIQKAYTVKVNEYTVDLRNAEEVKQFLNAALDKYDKNNEYEVELTPDLRRNINVQTVSVVTSTQDESVGDDAISMQGGISAVFANAQISLHKEEKDFEDFDLGMLSMNFTQEVEVVEAYLPANQLMDLDAAITEVTMEEEKNKIYEVMPGDTLSEIAMLVNIPMDKIIDLNSALEDESTIIRQGQELIITVPEPKLSVEWKEENYYEEIYDAPITYIDNDSWYTTQTKVHQEPSAGFRKVIAIESYINQEMVNREIIKEEIIMEAVAKVVERGTIIPPTYIKPLSGGRLSSGFGRRNSPTKGASTYHKGTDWATPIGTAVVASSGGVVSRAGWGSGYGYVIYIDHPDGRQTRYGHLSKILVRVGETVSQGERIALSGNTGISSGPHVHFEILINGKQVNPTKYI
ncbi:MAG: M23 family metallopeptidase, partial [Lachnospiraceae bacterium]|nr:M23 family metallopeptidase [Lachnospiraceae bacterium]